jgi:IS605 OrfB family transposase
VQIEAGRGTFDFVMKVTSMVPREPIVIPFKSHVRLNYWLAKPGAKLLDGAIVSETCAWVYVRVPDEPLKTEGTTIGLDVGFNKLIADSDGHFHGQEIKTVCATVRRKKPGSLGKRRARRQRQDYVNFVCRRLPWQTTKTFVLEDLTGMKVGKGRRGKRNRKLLAPWSYQQVRTRLEQLAPEHRVSLAFIDPKGTSRLCPSCGLESAKNRVGEKFDCVRCHYTADADTVGAINARNKFTTGTCPETMIPVAI